MDYEFLRTDLFEGRYAIVQRVDVDGAEPEKIAVVRAWVDGIEYDFTAGEDWPELDYCSPITVVFGPTKAGAWFTEIMEFVKFGERAAVEGSSSVN